MHRTLGVRRLSTFVHLFSSVEHFSYRSYISYQTYRLLLPLSLCLALWIALFFQNQLHAAASHLTHTQKFEQDGDYSNGVALNSLIIICYAGVPSLYEAHSTRPSPLPSSDPL